MTSGATVASLEFLCETLRVTPLRRYAGCIDPPSEAVRTALRDGIEVFASDLARWSLAFDSPQALFDSLLLRPSLAASYFYRITHALHLEGAGQAADVLAALARLLTGIEIYYSAEIGPGLKIIHGLGTVIGAGCRIGAGFTVYQGVTVGDRLGLHTGPRPEVGDRVIVSAGAKILGPVRVGAESVVGANAVVLDSLPERSLAVGAPATTRRRLSDEAFADFWKAVGG